MSPWARQCVELNAEQRFRLAPRYGSFAGGGEYYSKRFAVPPAGRCLPARPRGLASLLEAMP